MEKFRSKTKELRHFFYAQKQKERNENNVKIIYVWNITRRNRRANGNGA